MVMEGLLKPLFEPFSSVPFKFLTFKRAFLVALCSGRRRSALAALSYQGNYLRFENSGVRLNPFSQRISV